MSWYSIFYWITVADGVKDFFRTFSIIFTCMSGITLVVFGIMVIALNDGFDPISEKAKQSLKYWISAFRRVFVWSTIFCFINWAGYIFCPNKRDALIIVAGGAVGNFITSDSSARTIPSEVMTLLRDKIRSEIREVNLIDGTDTLQSKTKEELIKMIQQK